MNTIEHGSYVECTRHGYKGRVYGFKRNPSYIWMKSQEIPVTQEQMDGLWVNILGNGGGAVCMPLDSVIKIEPFKFNNPYASDNFR